MYVAYHMTADLTKFGGDGVIKYVYYFILVTHIVLSIIIIPLVLITYVRALASLDKHKKIARITFPSGYMSPSLWRCLFNDFTLLC
jgi:putative membrane protein